MTRLRSFARAKIIAAVEPNFGCAPIRSPVVWLAECSQQCDRLRELYSPRSQHAVIRVYDHTGNVIETHERKGDFKE